MRILIFFFMLMFSLVGEKVVGQCPTNITLSSQAAVDAFATTYPDCVNQGWVTDLTVNGSDITDLSALNVVDSIAGGLTIQNTTLTTLSSWNTLTYINGLNLANNSMLADISALSSISFYNYLFISSSPLLIDITPVYNSIISGNLLISNIGITSLSGFNNIIGMGAVNIRDNINLISITGFQNLIEPTGISILGNPNLDDISGFVNVESAGTLTLNGTSLTSLSGLNSLKMAPNGFPAISIQDNIYLTDISQLSNLTYIFGIRIQNNPLLSDCCLVRELQVNNIVSGSLIINNNAPSCTSYLDILTSCPDSDNDGILDTTDNCPNDANTLQADTDNDGIGDGCDNCPTQANPQQTDSNGNGIGDSCDSPNATLYGIHNEQGDTYISDPTKGVILTTPDGTCYRIRVNSEGTLETYQVVCPQ